MAMGSTVFFILVSVPAVTEPKLPECDAEIPTARHGLASTSRSSILAATNGRRECRQRGVVPADLADARKRRLAEAHLDLVAQDDSQDQVLAGSCRTARRMPWPPA